MLGKLIENKEKLHTRNIQLATYPYTDSRLIVHGILKDRRYTTVFDVTGEVKKPGTVHHLDVKFLIETTSLVIEDAEVQMIHVPLDECRITLDTIEKLKGLEIKAGFSKKIRGIMGGKKGCGHLCHLIIAMSQEIVQGALAYKRKDRSPVPTDIASLSDSEFLIDSCRMWTKGGPKMKALQKAIKNQQHG